MPCGLGRCVSREYCTRVEVCVDDEMDKKMLILHGKVYDGSCLGLIKDTCYRKGERGKEEGRGGKRREEEGRGGKRYRGSYERATKELW